jgi:hypothetical protein
VKSISRKEELFDLFIKYLSPDSQYMFDKEKYNDDLNLMDYSSFKKFMKMEAKI